MSLVKTKLRNKMCDSLLDDCLVTYIERDIFFEVNEEDIIETFMALRKRRLDKYYYCNLYVYCMQSSCLFVECQTLYLYIKLFTKFTMKLYVH